MFVKLVNVVCFHCNYCNICIQQTKFVCNPCKMYLKHRLSLTVLFLCILIISTIDICTDDRELYFLQFEYGLMGIGQIEGLILMIEVQPSCCCHCAFILRCAVLRATAPDILMASKTHASIDSLISTYPYNIHS